ncbi:unnamed protein product [Heligmosomoides polygyrus]|uniref:Uncharacterized protein n=1 Tax=Heligmosomoides polygyrus TaxID=6339 RepID=A0A183FS95_HELPZ|nr:unnamed protein product [Heligmosomoides polygyrus]
MGTPTSCGRQRLAGARHLGECDGEPPEDDGVGGGLPVCQFAQVQIRGELQCLIHLEGLKGIDETHFSAAVREVTLLLLLSLF